MPSTIEKKIQNYVQRKYTKGIVENYDLKKTMRTNVLITSYFTEKMPHLAYDNNSKQKKFFYSFRTKYINSFKKNKQLINSYIYQYKKSKAVKNFKDRYTEEEWEKNSGDALLKFLALENKMKGREINFDLIEDLILIMTKTQSNTKYLAHSKFLKVKNEYDKIKTRNENKKANKITKRN